VKKLKRVKKRQRRLVSALFNSANHLGTAEDIDKLARRQVRVTKEHNEECKKLLSLMGIPVVTVSNSPYVC
jgi:5'-3' exonuclease